MTQQSFVSRRESSWNEFEIMIRGGRKSLKARAGSFPMSYRELTQDLNTARAHGFDPSIIERLNMLVLEGNEILYGARSFSLKGIADFVIRVFPRAVRGRRRSLGAAALTFCGIAFFSCLLCVRFPGMAVDLLGEAQAWQIEQMYNPEDEHYLVPREVSSDADMFGYYIYNNISIAFQAFAGGILAGFGSLLVLCFNALFLGAATGHIINKGFGATFFPFIIAHSAFELTAIVMSAEAGLLLGYRLFVTKGLSRSASLREAGKTALPIIGGAALMLVVAASVEAFWSSRHELPLPLRYGAGGFSWLLVILYFLFSGREKK
jgi:uncharacterized membrane protein SpoIIM required for sporulation